ncbi:MAG: hypothetical protein JWO30_5012 [Fibrobacteres bacterium]|nr:hypothetical protein [Fibrobacterota bacterium]
MKMRKQMRAVLTAGAMLAAQAAFGQKVSGIVTDSAGAPIAAASLKLENSGETTTSAPDGSFSLSGNTSILNAVPRAPIAAIREGSMFISLAERSEITITAFGIDGKALSSLRRQLDAGSHAVKLLEIGSGVGFYKVKSGPLETVVTAFSIDGALRASPVSLGNPAGQSALAKNAAQGATAAYDVLTATKTGYLKYYLNLGSSDTSGVKVKMIKENAPHFSFFVTSLKGLQTLSGNQKGFGGDLRFGETGNGAGLRGADKICAGLAEMSMPGSASRGWRAFLSVSVDNAGKPANAIDRIGEGPWYDRVGRMLAPKKADLLGTRPANGDPIIQVDLPNEDGIPNHRPDPTKPEEDNHHFLTGSDATGKLYGPTATCLSWTSSATTSGRPRTGFSFPAGNRINWISGQDEGGCGVGVNLVETGGSDPNNPIVGSGGGYGGFYCFAFNP